MQKRQLNQSEIDQYFNGRENAAPLMANPNASSIDFRSLGRIAQAQLHSFLYLHDRFMTSLTATLSVYLRAYTSAAVFNVEQMPYSDFVGSLTAPTCAAYLKVSPYEGQGIVEIQPSLLSVILDLMLGGTGKMAKELNREITEVETDLLDGLFRLIARDLTEAWKPVGPMNFELDLIEPRPMSSKRIPSAEVMVIVAMELRIGEASGLLNVAVPSRMMKMIRQKMDEQDAAVKSGSIETESAVRRWVARELTVDIACEMRGPEIRLQDLLTMKVGNVIDLGTACRGRVVVTVGDKPKFGGELVQSESKIAVLIDAKDVTRRDGSPRSSQA